MVTSPDCHLRAIKGILLYHSQLFAPLCRTAIDLDPPRLLSVNRSNETFFPIDEQRISRLQFIDICLMKMLIVIDRQCDDNIAFILMDLLRFEPSCKGTVVKMRHIEGFPDWFNRERFRPLSFLRFIPFGLLLRLIIFSHSLADRPLALLIDSPFLCGCLRCRARTGGHPYTHPKCCGDPCLFQSSHVCCRPFSASPFPGIFVTVQYLHSHAQKSIKNCLRQWDFSAFSSPPQPTSPSPALPLQNPTQKYPVKWRPPPA